MLIRYIGELFERTGYGEAARINVALLKKIGHDVQCVPTGAKTTIDTNWKYQVIKECINFDTNDKPDLVIAHIYPPKELARFKIDGVPLISYIAWETDLLPAIWTYNLNKYADFVITTCHEMQKVFQKSGVIKPVYVLGPTIFDQDLVTKCIGKYPDFANDGSYKFYSIFQWIERKDPTKLISAFIQEFDSVENVSLVLKTYRHTYDKSEFDVIINQIKTISTECGITTPPAIRLVPNALSDADMAALHNACHCYVSPHRGEGSGLGIIDAILNNKRLIVTSYGGPEDFLGPHALKLDYRMIPIQNPLWCYNYFNAYMNWADVDIRDLRRKMRYVYSQRSMDLNNELEEDKQYLLNVYGESKSINQMNSILNNVK